MSATLLLSAEAIDDIRDLLQYTFETWGEQQVHSYQAIIDKALTTIQTSPNIGHRRPDISPEHRVFPAGQHLIIYRPSENIVYVVRVLQKNRDIGRHLPSD